MRRSMVWVVGVAAALAVVAAGLAVALLVELDDRPGYADRHAAMVLDRDPAGRDRGERGPGRWGHGRGWDRHGAAPYWPGGGPMGAMAHTVASEHAWLVEMVAHHEEAIEAAGELSRSRRPELRAFGQRIVRTQGAQAEQMRGWLVRWYPRPPADPEYRPMMRDLSGLSGDELDRAFLRDMVPHHMAAVMMSQQLVRHGLARHDQVERLAGAIRDEQYAEIVRMTHWLRTWTR